jgi:hypothetical protein
MATMSSRLLLSGVLTDAAVRRKRKSDGAVFAVATIRDRDRLENRMWRVFANNDEVIERLEDMRVGEPIAASGPFYVAIDGGQLVYRMTIEALVDVKRGKKPRGLIAKESRVESAEVDLAPLNDELPDMLGARS